MAVILYTLPQRLVPDAQITWLVEVALGYFDLLTHVRPLLPSAKVAQSDFAEIADLLDQVRERLRRLPHLAMPTAMMAADDATGGNLEFRAAADAYLAALGGVDQMAETARHVAGDTSWFVVLRGLTAKSDQPTEAAFMFLGAAWKIATGETAIAYFVDGEPFGACLPFYAAVIAMTQKHDMDAAVITREINKKPHQKYVTYQ